MEQPPLDEKCSSITPSQIPSGLFKLIAGAPGSIHLSPQHPLLSDATQGTSAIGLSLKYRCRRRLQCRWTSCLASWR